MLASSEAEATSALFSLPPNDIERLHRHHHNRGVGAWERSSATPQSPPLCSTACCTAPWSINLDDQSYRLLDHRAAAETLRRTTTGDTQQLH